MFGRNAKSVDIVTRPKNEEWRQTGVPPEGFMIVPPDGKWGWVVIFGCCLCGLCAVTVTITFGVLLNDLIRLLHTNTATITWTLAISAGTGNVLGPVVAIVINTYSCRSSVMMGGMLLSTGFILSSYVETVGPLMVTFGLLTGIGSCLTFLPLPVILSRYFRKYFGIAMGCVTAAYALSKLALTPMIQLFLQEYGCRGTLLIMGGLMLNVCVGASLFQPVKWHLMLVPKTDDKNTTISEEPVNQSLIPENGDAEGDLKSSRTLNDNDDFKTVIPEIQLQDTENQQTVTYNNEKHRLSNVSLHLASSLDIFGATNAEIKVTNEKSSKVKNNGCCGSWLEKLAKSIDHTLLKERAFYIVCIQNSLLIGSMVYGTMYMFPFGIEVGLLPMQAAGLVSTRSIGELVGRLFGPMILTALKLPIRITYMTFIFLHAILLLVLIYMKTFLSLYSVAGLSGLAFGAAVGLNGLLIVHTMGVKRLASVLGLVGFFMAFFLFALGPITGWIRDITGTFGNCLLLIVVLQFLIIILWLLKPLIVRKTIQDTTI